MAAASHNRRLGAIDRASTTEQVLRELREAIIDGRIAHGVARLAVEASPPPDLSRLRAAMDDLRTTAEGHDRVTDELIEADIRFHEELVRLAGSPRLTRAHETLVAETRMLLRHHPVYPWSDYVSDHERLFDAIEQRDPRAPEYAIEHLRLSARLIGEELDRETDRAKMRGGSEGAA